MLDQRTTGEELLNKHTPPRASITGLSKGTKLLTDDSCHSEAKPSNDALCPVLSDAYMEAFVERMPLFDGRMPPELPISVDDRLPKDRRASNVFQVRDLGVLLTRKVDERSIG